MGQVWRWGWRGGSAGRVRVVCWAGAGPVVLMGEGAGGSTHHARDQLDAATQHHGARPGGIILVAVDHGCRKATETPQEADA